MCVQARDSKCLDCDDDVQELRYPVSARYLHTALHPALRAQIQISGVYLKMKSPHFSPDLISSPEIISTVLTLLSKYVNIIANYFLAPCTFYFRLREKFVFLESLCSRQYSCSRSDPSCSIVWELAITLHYITLPLHNNVMLPHHPLCLSQPAVCSYKVYCSAPQPTSRVLTDNLIR